MKIHKKSKKYFFQTPQNYMYFSFNKPKTLCACKYASPSWYLVVLTTGKALVLRLFKVIIAAGECEALRLLVKGCIQCCW